jgi:hypothetical protein
VSIITNTAERKAAIEFAKAGATRPQIVGEALQGISQDLELSSALFSILEMQKIIAGEARITLLSGSSNEFLASLLAVSSARPPSPPVKK